MSDERGKTSKNFRASSRTRYLQRLRDQEAVDDFEFEMFGWYFLETEKLIKQMEKEEIEFIQEQSSLGESEPNDSGIIAVNFYARRVHYTHVIYLASLLESVMKRECRRLIDTLGEQSAPFRPSELNGDSWSAKRKVLERYGRFKIERDQWKPVQHLLNVRNILVHDNGAVDSLSEQQRAAIEKARGIRIISDELETTAELEITAEYIQSAFEAVQAIGRFLNDKVGEVIDRSIRPLPAK